MSLTQVPDTTPLGEMVPDPMAPTEEGPHEMINVTSPLAVKVPESEHELPPNGNVNILTPVIVPKLSSRTANMPTLNRSSLNVPV